MREHSSSSSSSSSSDSDSSSEPVLQMYDHDQVLGLLLGLAAGDRNGGPIQMSLALGESIHHNQSYDPVHVFHSYLTWWKQGSGVDAWDTGPLAAQIFAKASALKKKTPESLLQISHSIDQTKNGMTAGVNALHRISIMAALFPCRSDAELAALAWHESSLTHFNPISQHACAVVVVLCRKLMKANAAAAAATTTTNATYFSILKEVVQISDSSLAPPSLSDANSSRTTNVLRDAVNIQTQAAIQLSQLKRGGFCLDALQAAFYFVGKYDTFKDALDHALQFAGSDNYCAVLVGAIGGARWGAAHIVPEQLTHCRPGVEDRCRALVSNVFRSATSPPLQTKSKVAHLPPPLPLLQVLPLLQTTPTPPPPPTTPARPDSQSVLISLNCDPESTSSATIISQLRSRIGELKNTLEIERQIHSNFVIQSQAREASFMKELQLTGTPLETSNVGQPKPEPRLQDQYQQTTITRITTIKFINKQMEHLKAQLDAGKRRFQHLLTTTNNQISRAHEKNATLEGRLQQLLLLVKQLPQMIENIEQSRADIECRMAYEKNVLRVVCEV